MSRKTLITICLVTVSFVPSAWALDCNGYITQGRALLFDGTLDGIRQAYQKFDTGLTSCSTNEELRFFHAVAGMAMLLVKDDGGSIDSVFELAKEFGVDVVGDYWAVYFGGDPCEVDLNIVLNEHDAYQIPFGAPTIDEIRNTIDTSMIPQIDEFIADLNLISDTFAISLHPNETRIFHDPNLFPLLTDIEVDYGEVLLLKGLLMALKSHLQAQQAYDLYTDPDAMLAEKIYGGWFDINADLLTPYPDFLNVLPTDNDPNIGADILAQARQDLIDSINYYLDAVDYIRNEADPQENDLIYIDPNQDFAVETINQKLIILRDSLQNDTVMTHLIHFKTYTIYQGLTPIGQLVLVWDPYDITGISGDEGSLTFTIGTPTPWVVENFDCGDGLTAEVEYGGGGWAEGWFEGTLSADGNSITAATFDYWGSVSGTLTGLSGVFFSTEVLGSTHADLNPIFGSSGRYPNPVNPRDLLPEFDEWNGPQPGTVGHGLGDDATLGGIVPDMNQYDWGELQPGGLVTITSREITVNGILGDWTDSQLVLDDICGDADEEVSSITGADIDQLYMAYNSTYLFGAITFCSDINSNNGYWYILELSYSPDESEALGAIRLEIYVNDGFPSGDLSYRDLSSGHPGWHWYSHLTVAKGTNAVEFSVPRADIPGSLPGRFIALDSSGWDADAWQFYDGADEWNGTHLKIAGLGSTQLGTITGTVNVASFPDYNDAPIFVQAYTDPWDPEDSLVASTMISAPGTYTLNGIGVGWQGYVRAFTPLFGFNIFDPEAMTVDASVAVPSTTRTGVNLALRNPILLSHGAWVAGAIDPNYEQDWYAFDAVQNRTYWLDLTRGTSTRASMTLYGCNGHTEVEELYYWETQHIEWSCPTSAGGRYYVKVSNDPYYYESNTGTYQIRVIVKQDDSPPDFNGDGKTDILWRKSTTGLCRIDLMDGLTKTGQGWIGGDLNWEIVPVP